MPTISANIKWATNLAELRKELQSGTDQLVVLQKAAERTERNLGGEGLMRAAHNAAVAVQQLGGTAALTASEQTKMNSLMTRTIEKMQALNQAAAAAGKPLMTIPTAFREIAASTAQVSHVGGVFGDLANQVKATALGFLSAQAIIGVAEHSFHALTEFVSGSVEAYAKQEAATKKVTTALVAQGNATPTVIGHMDDLAKSFESTTVNSDETISAMEALLVEIGNVAPTEMKKALTAATDLSAGLGVDLETATKLVGKAFAGETGTLKRYGIVIDEAKLKAEGMPAVLDAIQQRFGGQAQAETETYTGKVKQLANAWDNLKESIGEQIVNDPLLIQALREMKERAEGGSTSVGGLQAAFNGFMLAMPDWIKGLRAWKDQAEADAEATNTLADAVARMNAVPPPKPFAEGPGLGSIFARRDAEMKAGAEETIKTWQKEDEAAKQHIAALQAAFDKWSGADAQKQIVLLDSAFRRMAASGKITEVQVRAMAAEAVRLAHDGAVLSPRLWDVVLALGALDPPITAGIANLSSLGEKFELTIPAVVKFKDAVSGIDDLASHLPKLDLGYQFERAKAPIDKADKSLELLSKSLANLATVSDGSLGDIVKNLSTVVAAIDASEKSVESFEKGLEAVKSGSTLKGLSGMATGILGIASAAMAAGKAVKGLWDHFAGTAGRDAVKQFAQELTGSPDLNALQAKLRSVLDPAQAEHFWVLLTQGTGRGNAAQAAANITLVKDAIAAAEKKQATFNATLGSFLGRVRDLQGGLPASLKDYLAGLEKAGKLTQDNIDLLHELAGNGEVDWKKIEEAVNRYGGDISKLGGSFQEARLHDSWQQVIDDMDLFEKGGISAGDALSVTKGKIIDLVQQSMKFGTEIPENMRPWIQNLIDTGELVDIDGQKITDIGKLKFGETLQTSIDHLTDAIKLLIEQFNKVPEAVDRIPKTVDVDVNYRQRTTGTAPTETGGGDLVPSGAATGGFVGAGKILHFDRGGLVPVQYFPDGGMARIIRFVSKGSDTVPAMLTPGEGILNTRAMADLGIEGLRTLNSGRFLDNLHAAMDSSLPAFATAAGGGQMLRSTTILEVDKRALGRVVADVLPGELRRLGVRVRT
jgi:hypothetical protein